MKILFISHDARRTGAPFVLLHLLRWLKEHSNIEVSLLFLRKGQLIEAFQEVSHKTILADYNKSFINRLKRKLLGGALREVSRMNAQKKFDLVYFNTVATTAVLSEINQIVSCPKILHVHENDYSIKSHYKNALSSDNIELINHFIAVSKSTQNSLLDQFHIPKEKLSLIHEFIPTNQFKKPSISRTDMLARLGIKQRYIIGGCGSGNWRKGIDLFFRLADTLNTRYKDIEICCMWIGPLSHDQICAFEYEKQRLNLKNVILTGNVTDPENYLQLLDLFVLTSREDPFPLVCLEAAALGKPIICFENSGGMPEFVEKDAGIIIPYGNIDTMASEIIRLLENPTKKEILGRNASKKVANYDVAVKAPQILELIKKVIN